jgi:hypothetical protein
MIKASTRLAGGKSLLVLGLSRKTTEALLAGKAISVDLMGPTGKEGTVILMADETDEAVAAKVRPLMGPATRWETTRE